MGKTSHDNEDPSLILTTKRKLIPSVQRKAPSTSPVGSDPEDSDVAEQPPKKVKKTAKKAKETKTKPSKAAKAKVVGSDEDIEVVPSGVDHMSAVIDWKDTDLSFRLVNAITDDPAIRRALYPPVGPTPTTQKGGGKPKTDFQWKLCSALFENDPKYGPALQHAHGLTGKAAVAARSTWAGKIKNRLKVMETKTRDDMKMMGEMGAGISSEDQINMTMDNQFTTKWDLIKAAAPWFFEMRALILERPNLVRTGVGNGSSAIDTSILMDEPEVDEPDVAPDVATTEDPPPLWGCQPTQPVSELAEAKFEGGNSSDDDSLPSVRVKKAETKLKVKAEKHTKKTAALSATSKPAGPRPSWIKPKNVVDRFAEVAKIEEETA